MEQGDKHIRKALDLSEELILLADSGDAVRTDVGCGVLYGTIRDCAYKIQSLAEIELEKHRRQTSGGSRPVVI